MRRTVKDLLAHDEFTVIGNHSGGAQVKAWLEGQGKVNVSVTDQIRNKPGAFVIGSFDQPGVAYNLLGAGVAANRIFPFVNDMFAPHYGEDGLAVPFIGLADEESQDYLIELAVFYRAMKPWRLKRNQRAIGHYGYDAPGANPKPGARIVDCGAYIGDTIPEFLNATGGDCRIHAFETEPMAFFELCRNVPPQAHPEKVRVSSYSDAKTGRFTLDELISDRRIDYIKIDVEGDDLDVLFGAERILREDRPTVACAAYHKPEHITQIANVLQERLAPCKLYASHDPKWWFHLHYICVPEERAH